MGLGFLYRLMQPKYQKYVVPIELWTSSMGCVTIYILLDRSYDEYALGIMAHRHKMVSLKVLLDV